MLYYRTGWFSGAYHAALSCSSCLIASGAMYYDADCSVRPQLMPLIVYIRSRTDWSSLLAGAWGPSVSHTLRRRHSSCDTTCLRYYFIGGVLPACLPDIRVRALIQAVVSNFQRRPCVVLGCNIGAIRWFCVVLGSSRRIGLTYCSHLRVFFSSWVCSQI